MIDDKIRDQMAGTAFERNIPARAAEDRNRQARPGVIARGAKPPPGAHRIDHDKGEPGLEHLLGHDRGGIAFPRPAHRGNPEGFGHCLRGEG